MRSREARRARPVAPTRAGDVPQRAPRLRRYRPRVLALLAGAVPALAFPHPNLGLLAWVALVPGLLLAWTAPSPREAALRGWWCGAGFFLTVLNWLVPTIGPVWPLIGVVYGVLWAVPAWFTWELLCGRSGVSRVLVAAIVVPSAWLAGEFARSWQGLGGPWAVLGATQWRHPVQLALAAVGGVWLVSVAIVAANVGIVAVLVAGTRGGRVAGAVVVLLAVLAGPAVAVVRGSPRPERTLRVALVQPGLIHAATPRLAAEVRATTRRARGADLVVWGESSVGFDIRGDAGVRRRLRGLSREVGTELLVNEDARDAAGRLSKAAVLIGPDGEHGRYVKTRLVPFGEYIPLRPLLGWITDFTRAADQDRVPGTGVRVLRVHTSRGDVRVGPLICFESTFGDMSRVATDRGARLIVYQSSTSTFQGTWGPDQHAALGAVRAAETGRPVVQAALTGESVAYDAQGRRLAQLGMDGRGVVRVRVDLLSRGWRTPYDRIGDVVPVLALVLTVPAGGALLLRRRARRRGARTGRPSAAAECGGAVGHAAGG